MWGHFGDIRRPSAGSYFHDSAEQVNYYWNVFDQVLIRPELINGFEPAKLRIVTAIGGSPLVEQDGRPDSGNYSDHLPIVFELEF